MTSLRGCCGEPFGYLQGWPETLGSLPSASSLILRKGPQDEVEEWLWLPIRRLVLQILSKLVGAGVAAISRKKVLEACCLGKFWGKRKSPILHSSTWGWLPIQSWSRCKHSCSMPRWICVGMREAAAVRPRLGRLAFPCLPGSAHGDWPLWMDAYTVTIIFSTTQVIFFSWRNPGLRILSQ